DSLTGNIFHLKKSIRKGGKLLNQNSGHLLFVLYQKQQCKKSKHYNGEDKQIKRGHECFVFLRCSRIDCRKLTKITFAVRIQAWIGKFFAKVAPISFHWILGDDVLLQRFILHV